MSISSSSSSLNTTSISTTSSGLGYLWNFLSLFSLWKCIYLWSLCLFLWSLFYFLWIRLFWNLFLSFLFFFSFLHKLFNFLSFFYFHVFLGSFVLNCGLFFGEYYFKFVVESLPDYFWLLYTAWYITLESLFFCKNPWIIIFKTSTVSTKPPSTAENLSSVNFFSDKILVQYFITFLGRVFIPILMMLSAFYHSGLFWVEISFFLVMCFLFDNFFCFRWI